MQKKYYFIFIILLIFGAIIFSYFFFFKKSNNLNFALQRFDLVKDKNLIGGTGLEFGHRGRVWLNALSGDSVVYSGLGEQVETKDKNGKFVDLSVKIPSQLMGLVFSSDHSFSDDAFIFTTMDGKIFGWHKLVNGLEPLNATLRVDNSLKKAKYTGATSFKSENGWRLYVADFENNKIEVYDEKYNLLDLKNSFLDPKLSKNYSVFNVKNIEGNIYVSYRDRESLKGGAINIFSPDGQLIKNLVLDGELNAPWGMAFTNNTFGEFTGNLLVGNFGTGDIIVYGLTDGKYISKVIDEKGEVLKIQNLMALTFGTNNGAGKVNELFFSSGKDEGIFGKLKLVLNNGVEKNLNNLDEFVNRPNDILILKDFLTNENKDKDFNSFMDNLYKNCLKECLAEKTIKKEKELDTLYNKIISDSEILKKEYLAQGIDGIRNQKLEDIIIKLKNLPATNWKEFTKKYCDIIPNNYFAGAKLEEMKDICYLYKTDEWIKDLYTLRSIYIRFELGPLGLEKNAKTLEFKNLIEEEEDRINKTY